MTNLVESKQVVRRKVAAQTVGSQSGAKQGIQSVRIQLSHVRFSPAVTRTADFRM